MGEMACKQARLASAIAAQTRLGHSFLRKQRPLMRSMPTFQRPVGTPQNMGRLPTVLAGKLLPDESAEAAIVQRDRHSAKRGLRGAPQKSGRIRVGRRTWKGGRTPRQWREHGGPAQQPEQAVDFCVLGAEHWRFVGGVASAAQRPFHRSCRAWMGQGGRLGGLLCNVWRAASWGATAPPPGPAARCRLAAAYATLGFSSLSGAACAPAGPASVRRMAAQVFVHADAAVPRAGVRAVGVNLFGQPIGCFSQACPPASATWRGGAAARGWRWWPARRSQQQAVRSAPSSAPGAGRAGPDSDPHRRAALKRPRRIRRHHFITGTGRSASTNSDQSWCRLPKQEPQPCAGGADGFCHATPPSVLVGCRGSRLGCGVVRLQELGAVRLGQRLGRAGCRPGGKLGPPPRDGCAGQTQLGQVHGGRIRPAQGQQRRGGGVDVANLLASLPAQKPRAASHHQPPAALVQVRTVHNRRGVLLSAPSVGGGAPASRRTHKIVTGSLGGLRGRGGGVPPKAVSVGAWLGRAAGACQP